MKKRPRPAEPPARAPPRPKPSEPEEALQSSPWYPILKRPEIYKALADVGFRQPSAVQAKAIPLIIRGRDVVVQSQSGTGKTAVFLLSSLSVLDPKLNAPQVLILSPTRELAAQTQRVASLLADHFPAVRPRTCVGGTEAKNEIALFENPKEPQQIISGTPGRVLGMLQKNHLNASKIGLLVVDEADEMVAAGFQASVSEVYRRLASLGVQVVLVSATMTREVEVLASDLLDNPARVVVETSRDLSLDGIHQYKVEFDDPLHRYDALCELYTKLVSSQAIIFCNTKTSCEAVWKHLTEAGFSCSKAHGDLAPDERANVTAKFRSGAIRVLIATDVWGRGLDVQQIALVINFEMPVKPEQYLHRVGRSGRFGRKGVAVSFLRRGHPDDEDCLKRVTREYGAIVSDLPKNPRKVLEHFRSTSE